MPRHRSDNNFGPNLLAEACGRFPAGPEWRSRKASTHILTGQSASRNPALQRFCWVTKFSPAHDKRQVKADWANNDRSWPTSGPNWQLLH